MAKALNTYSLRLDAIVDQRGRFADLVLRSIIYGVAALVMLFFIAMVGQIVWGGIGQWHLSFFTQGPRSAGRAGGIAPILVSTLLILAVCLATSVPLALSTAILLAQYDNHHRLSRFVRHSLDVLAGVPSIVFGLFGNAFFCIYLKMGFSILSGGLTLACMALPILIRTMEMAIRSVPKDYHQAASALGMGPVRTWMHLILPAAAPGLAAALILGIGRALAETAALIFTSGYVDRMPESLSDSGRSLSIHIYDLAMNVPGGEPNAYASALVLIALLWLLNRLTAWLFRHCLGGRITYA